MRLLSILIVCLEHLRGCREHHLFSCLLGSRYFWVCLGKWPVIRIRIENLSLASMAKVHCPFDAFRNTQGITKYTSLWGLFQEWINWNSSICPNVHGTIPLAKILHWIEGKKWNAIWPLELILLFQTCLQMSKQPHNTAHMHSSPGWDYESKSPILSGYFVAGIWWQHL